MAAITGFLFIKYPESPKTEEGGLLQIVNGSDHPEAQSGEIRRTLKLLVSNKMLLMVPQLMYTGVSCSFYLGLMTPILILSMENTDDFRDLTEKEKIA